MIFDHDILKLLFFIHYFRSAMSIKIISRFIFYKSIEIVVFNTTIIKFVKDYGPQCNTDVRLHFNYD